MAAQAKCSWPQCIRLRIGAECGSEAARDGLAMRLSRVRELLMPRGSNQLEISYASLEIFFEISKSYMKS